MRYKLMNDDNILGVEYNHIGMIKEWAEETAWSCCNQRIITGKKVIYVRDCYGETPGAWRKVSYTITQ